MTWPEPARCGLFAFEDAWTDITEGANAHLELAQGIATCDEAAAVAGANRLLDYLERFARRVIDK